jgi:hypothetical protein
MELKEFGESLENGAFHGGARRRSCGGKKVGEEAVRGNRMGVLKFLVRFG